MTYCVISGVWNGADGQPLANHVVTATPRFGIVSDLTGSAVVPTAETFTLDGSGDATVTLLAGQYSFTFTPTIQGNPAGWRGTVPAVASCEPGDIFLTPEPIDLVALQVVQSRLITADHTVNITDATKTLKVNSATPVTVTVPADADVDFPIGSAFSVMQTGIGTVTIAAAAGVTIHSAYSLVLPAQWTVGVLHKDSANTWILTS